MATAHQASSSTGSARDSLAGIKVIDVDTHLSEPYTLWTARASAKWKDRVPQVKTVDDKRQWVIDGKTVMGPVSAVSCVSADGEKSRGIEFFKWALEDVHAGSYDVKPRLEFMDGEGIWAQILYPNLLGFGGQRAATFDPELRLVCTQIYNDAMAEIQQQSGRRLYDGADAVVGRRTGGQGNRRCHKMGIKGINTNSSPQDHGIPDLGQDYWTPLWEVCSDLRMPINFHIGTSTESMDFFGKSSWSSQTDDRKLALGSTMLFLHNAQVFANIIYSGILERFPKLKFVSVESGVGWMPFLLEALDYELDEAAPKSKEFLSMKPSEYFRRQIYACFWFEQRAFARRSTRWAWTTSCSKPTSPIRPACIPTPWSMSRTPWRG